ncbi:MAG TPA: iron-sulfur cluster assembly accessory protein [Gammaproteobacteria bacterium]|nr:iron-sulfur cluster assembly accessory protein [Gammaproteobacteria bacterium]
MSQHTYPAAITDEFMLVTASAGEKIAQLLRSADSEINSVRIFVSGGGCNGMNYGMTFTEGTQYRDSVLRSEDYQIVVDPVALGYLKGCEIDYVEDGVNTSFVFNNVFQSVGGTGGCSGCGGGACGM